MFEWQKALFFILLNWVPFVNNGRFQIIEVIEGFILKERFFEIRRGSYIMGIIYLSVKPPPANKINF